MDITMFLTCLNKKPEPSTSSCKILPCKWKYNTVNMIITLTNLGWHILQKSSKTREKPKEIKIPSMWLSCIDLINWWLPFQLYRNEISPWLDSASHHSSRHWQKKRNRASRQNIVQPLSLSLDLVDMNYGMHNDSQKGPL